MLSQPLSRSTATCRKCSEYRLFATRSFLSCKVCHCSSLSERTAGFGLFRQPDGKFGVTEIGRNRGRLLGLSSRYRKREVRRAWMSGTTSRCCREPVIPEKLEKIVGSTDDSPLRPHVSEAA